MNLIDEVKLELRELAKLDITVFPRAYQLADNLTQDEQDSMTVSEMADMCMDLASIGVSV